MSKILAVDFGLKRCGLAISDDRRIFAFGLETVVAKELMIRLKELVAKESVEIIVLGLPKHLDDTDAHITQNVYLLKEAILEEISGVTVELEDERFTSKMASQAIHRAGATNKQKKDKNLVDKVSATLILQSYLDQLANYNRIANL